LGQMTVRVELHGVRHDEAVYDKLHGFMETAGFSRTIRDAQTGQVFWLPPAEYIIVVPHDDRRRVCTLAEQAAAKTGRACSVLVTGSAYCTWSNLTEMKKKSSVF